MDIDEKTRSFLEALNRDSVMRERMKAAMDGAADPRAAAVAFAVAEGFAVTPESLEAAKQTLEASAALSDIELEEVAGGFNPQPEPPARTSPTDTTLTPLDPRISSNLLRR